MVKFKTQKLIVFCILNLFLIVHNSIILANELYSNSSEKKSKKEKYKSNNLEFFLLPQNQELIKENELGKVDPFSINNKALDQFGTIELLGVFSTAYGRYAIIKYKKITGEISEGQIGGEDTNLLPNKVLVQEININEPAITLKFKNKEYIISY